MSNHDKRPGATVRAQRVDRVAGALIRVSAQGMGRPGFRALARAALDELAPELREPGGRPDLHKQFPDIEPRLLDLLAHLEDEYGRAGVIHTIGKLWGEAPDLRHDPPEGCEAVWLPTEVVDRIARDGLGEIADACREAQARRPKRRTDRVPWWEAKGRRAVDPERLRVIGVIEEVGDDHDGPWAKAVALGVTWPVPIGDDGKVEVLVEDEGDGA